MLAEHRAACGDFTVVLIGARSGRGLCVSGRNGRARTQDHRRARLQTTQKKLAQATGGSHYIETVWGRGYVLRDLTHHLVADSPSRQVPATEVVRSQSSSAG